MKSKLLAASVVLGLSVVPTAAMEEFINVLQVVQSIGDYDYLEAASRVDTAPSVRVIRLSTMAGANFGPARLEEAVYIKQVDVAYLQNALLNNPIAMTAIRNSGVYLEQIVSLTMAGDGAAILFANDL